MPRPSRARWILKWTGAALCAAILVTWCFTISHDVYRRVPRVGLLFLGEGYVGLFAMNTEKFSDWEEPGVWATEAAPEFGTQVYDLWDYEPEDAWQASPFLGDLARRSLVVFLEGGGVAIPVSLVFTITLLPTAALFYRDRRRRFVSYEYSRLRHRLKWTGTVLAFLTFGAWFICLWYEWGVKLTEEIYVSSFNSEIRLFWIEDAKQLNWTNQFQGPQLGELGFIWPHYAKFADNTGESGYIAYIPFWLPLLFTAVPTAWLWNRDRRRILPGCCLRCGYDLTGNTSGVCSECGLAKPPPATV